MIDDATWHEEPSIWAAEPDGGLRLRTGPKTDFWRHTHYGFVRDNGHFLGARVAGDFELVARFRGSYRDRYDQAGLMVRLDAATWMKCGVEFVDGAQWASVVVTREQSDWSQVRLPAPPPPELRLVVRREGAAVHVSFGAPGATEPLRLAHLTAEPVLVGPMAASPDGDGFDVHFSEVTLTVR